MQNFLFVLILPVLLFMTQEVLKLYLIKPVNLVTILPPNGRTSDNNNGNTYSQA